MALLCGLSMISTRVLLEICHNGFWTKYSFCTKLILTKNPIQQVFGRLPLLHHWRTTWYIPAHSMARTNLKKSENLVTHTTAVSKCTSRRPRIYINWNPLFKTQIYLVSVKIVKQDLFLKEYFFEKIIQGDKYVSERF